MAMPPAATPGEGDGTPSAYDPFAAKVAFPWVPGSRVRAVVPTGSRDVRVHQGWSGEIAPNVWAKADVELEEDDLRRLAAEVKIPLDDLPRLPVTFVYRLLEVQAEILLISKLIARYGFDGHTKLAELRQYQTKIVSEWV